jgi:hypothetical protein
MASFDIDIGHGRVLCIEATGKGVAFNSYSSLPSGKIIKVSAKSIYLDVFAWKKFNDNLDLIKETFSTLVEGVVEGTSTTDFSLYLGKFIYIKAVSNINCIHFRRYFFDKQDKVLKPGRPGIAFKYSEFRELLNYLSSVNDITNIDSIDSCCTVKTQSDCPTCS